MAQIQAIGCIVMPFCFCNQPVLLKKSVLSYKAESSARLFPEEQGQKNPVEKNMNCVRFKT